jgi:hypothetical protein
VTRFVSLEFSSTVRELRTNHYPSWVAKLATWAEGEEEDSKLVSLQTKFNTCWAIRSCCP